MASSGSLYYLVWFSDYNSKPKYKMLDAYQPQLIGSQGWESYDSMPGSFEGLATIYKLSQSLYELYEDRRWL
jgi:hypothetical protein